MKLYDLDLSGNCQKVRMLLGFLSIPYEKISVDLMGGEHKSPKFLRMNPKGEIPVLIDGDITLYDSQAILVYLARKYDAQDWWPSGAEAQARVMVWLSTAANEIFHGPGAARLIRLLNYDLDYEVAARRARSVLALLDEHLRDRDWLELEHPTLADIAVFPYVAVARDGDIDLDQYDNVIAWINRIKALPGYVSMPGA